MIKEFKLKYESEQQAHIEHIIKLEKASADAAFQSLVTFLQSHLGPLAAASLEGMERPASFAASTRSATFRINLPRMKTIVVFLIKNNGYWECTQYVVLSSAGDAVFHRYQEALMSARESWEQESMAVAPGADLQGGKCQ